MMKKKLVLILALCLSCACCTAGLTEGADGQVHRIEKKTFPLYIATPENLWSDEFPVYFADGAEDLPYLELNDFAAVLESFLSSKEGDAEKGSITVTKDDTARIVTWVRKAGTMAAFNFAEKQIAWTDYLAFNQADDALYMNMLRGFKYTDSEGRPQLLEIGNVRERHGHAVVLDLGQYGIPMLAQDGLYLVPAQTLATFFLGTEGVSLYFNQQCLIITSPKLFDTNIVAFSAMAAVMDEIAKLQDSEMTEEEKQAKIVELTLQAQSEAEKSLFGMYTAGPKGERSAALADYGWRELCLELDNLYGLKDVHDVDTFLRYFTETGLLNSLTGSRAEDADQAVWDLTQRWLDDGHSVFYSGSYLSGEHPDETSKGFSKSARQALREQLTMLRAQYPNAAPGYYETGDTAFVTLDSFSYSGKDYYAAEQGNSLETDTFDRVIEAHRQITRENSPIRNVVLDLSQNVGGANPAAIYVISWMLGDAQLSVKDTFSGAETTAAFRADVNLDRVFDEQDTLAGRGLNLYCLTSPASFSCGNLVPWAFKADGSVKLMGSVTGGGSCAVWDMTTAWGTSLAISGPTRLSFLKNGSYYDVDRGVEPDYVISSFDHYYDREALAAYIDSLY